MSPTTSVYAIVFSYVFVSLIAILVQSISTSFTCPAADLKNQACNQPTSCLYQDTSNCYYYYKCSPSTGTAHKQCSSGTVYYAANKTCDFYYLYSKYCPPGSV